MDYPGKVITKTQVTPTQTSASGNWTLDDQAAAIKNNNWPVALVPNPISKSLRFNNADSTYLNRTPTTPTSRKIMTFSYWVKRAGLAKINQLWNNFSGATAYGQIVFDVNDKIEIFSRLDATTNNCILVTTPVYRDVSAWYHIVVQIDTTQATASNRVRLYVNGTQVTSFTSSTYPAQNDDVDFQIASRSTSIGRRADGSDSTRDFSGYLTEINFVDGQALTPSDFGLTNPQTGQWIPKKYTGTYGTNGFYLNFKDATSTTTLGYDYSGNANNWTTNNFSVTAGSGNDSLTDVPTPWVAYNTTGDVGGVVRGNYATLNPLFYNSLGSDLRNGNLDGYGITSSTAPYYRNYPSTIAVSSGKWFCELTIGNVANGFNLGIASAFGTDGLPTTYYSYNFWDQTYIVSGSSSAYGAKASNGDVIGMAVDLDNGTITWYRNGSSQGQKTGIAAGTYFLYTNMGFNSPAQNGSMNFGQRPFAYTPPAGFRSLCTTNLPATTIGFGLTNQGDDYFNAVLYTGDGTSGRQIDVGFAAELVWAKVRSAAGSNRVFDILRGAEKALLTNTTDAELTLTGELTAFNSTGWVVGNGGSLNVNGTTYVSWNWKAGGTGVTNTAGQITSTVSANTTAGFSIVTFTTDGTTKTVGHGLGVKPSLVIVKSRSAAGSWLVITDILGSMQYGVLNSTAAFTSIGYSAPTSTVFSYNDNNGVTQVAYCFAAVAGYSAFGSYTGNGSTDGPFVYTGFRPRYVLIKLSSNAGEGWVLNDTSRSPYNVCAAQLLANSSGAEVSGDANTYIDILSNGFKIRTTAGSHNTSAYTYIYAAFAESPFQFANAR